MAGSVLAQGAGATQAFVGPLAHKPLLRATTHPYRSPAPPATALDAPPGTTYRSQVVTWVYPKIPCVDGRSRSGSLALRLCGHAVAPGALRAPFRFSTGHCRVCQRAGLGIF